MSNHISPLIVSLSSVSRSIAPENFLTASCSLPANNPTQPHPLLLLPIRHNQILRNHLILSQPEQGHQHGALARLHRYTAIGLGNQSARRGWAQRD